MRRILVVVAACTSLAVPATVVGVTMGAGPASAVESVQCGKLTGSILGNVTIKGCVPKNKADKSVTGAAGALASGGTLTWSPGGQTTVVGAPTYSPITPGQCKKGWSEYETSGSVTGGTSSYTHAGDSVRSLTCVNFKTNKIQLLKGSILSL